MSKYVFDLNGHAVLWDNSGAHVVRPAGCVSEIMATFAADADGIGCAIAYAMHRGGDMRDPCVRAKEAMDMGSVIFSIGPRKAHNKWLEQ